MSIIAERGTNAQNVFSVLNCRRLPGRLNATEAAILLGVKEHDIPVLIAAKSLLPLGKAARNAPKYFAAVTIEAHSQNPDWLSNATRTLAKHWAKKNDKVQSASAAQVS